MGYIYIYIYIPLSLLLFIPCNSVPSALTINKRPWWIVLTHRNSQQPQTCAEAETNWSDFTLLVQLEPREVMAPGSSGCYCNSNTGYYSKMRLLFKTKFLILLIWILFKHNPQSCQRLLTKFVPLVFYYTDLYNHCWTAITWQILLLLLVVVSSLSSMTRDYHNDTMALPTIRVAIHAILLDIDY